MTTATSTLEKTMQRDSAPGVCVCVCVCVCVYVCVRLSRTANFPKGQPCQCVWVCGCVSTLPGFDPNVHSSSPSSRSHRVPFHPVALCCVPWPDRMSQSKCDDGSYGFLGFWH